MELENLKKEIPYKWRVQSFSKYKANAQCVAYVDARDVMNLLDEVCGAENWQDAYKVEGSMLFAGIGIKTEDGWVWKWDTGSESNIEKEKGHSSDAFKRAGVKWGICRFLYSLKIHTVNANEKKTKDNYPYVVDHNNKRVWDITEYINGLKGNAPTPKKEEEPEPEKLLSFEELMDKFTKASNVFELRARKKKYSKDIMALSDDRIAILKDAYNASETILNGGKNGN